MKQTMTTGEIADQLRADDNAAWSYKGSRAMAEYLEELEESLGEELEFDRVAIRCDYSEYESAVEAATDYGWKADEDEDEQEASAAEWLGRRTAAIPFDGGIIVQGF